MKYIIFLFRAIWLALSLLILFFSMHRLSLWAQCNNNIKIMRKYESEGKYTVRNLVKNKAIALELAEIYVKNRYGQDAAEEEKPYEITELTTSWVVEGTIHSDQIAGGVFIIEIGKNDGRILNFGHGK